MEYKLKNMDSDISKDESKIKKVYRKDFSSIFSFIITGIIISIILGYDMSLGDDGQDVMMAVPFMLLYVFIAAFVARKNRILLGKTYLTEMCVFATLGIMWITLSFEILFEAGIASGWGALIAVIFIIYIIMRQIIKDYRNSFTI